MQKKRIIVMSLIVLLVIIFPVLICSIIKNKTTVTNLNKYGNFDNFDVLGNLDIFPETILDEYVDNQYYFEYREGILDAECQIYLKCSYSRSTYKNETDRLAQIEKTYQGRIQKIQYDTENFSQPAYVSVFKNDGCYEYALLDEDNLSIIYIFLQWIKEEDIKFPDIYLPHNYDCVVSTEHSFSIYNFWDSDNKWYYVVPRVNEGN